MRYLVPLTLVLFITATVLYTTHLGFDISNTMSERGDSELKTLVRKHLDDWTDTERSTFMGLKEVQYSERRDRVRKFCVENQVTVMVTYHSLSGLTIISRRISPMGPPVWHWSTTRWTRCHTAPYRRWRAPPGAGTSYSLVSVQENLCCLCDVLLPGNVTQEEISSRRQVLQTFAPHLWPAPGSEELAGAWPHTLSLVIVRHPLSRSRRQRGGSFHSIPSDWCRDTTRSLSSWPNTGPGLPRSD